MLKSQDQKQQGKENKPHTDAKYSGINEFPFKILGGGAKN